MYRYCPSCGAEHRLGFTHCADCLVELMDEPPPPKTETEEESATVDEWADLVEIYRMAPMDADLMRSVLEGSGIPAVVQRAGSAAAYPLTVGDLGDAKLLVPRDRVQEALLVIDAAEGGDVSSEDQEIGNYGDESYGYEEHLRGGIPWLLRGVAIVLLVLFAVGWLAGR